jgi:hypothetical protein
MPAIVPRLDLAKGLGCDGDLIYCGAIPIERRIEQ